MSTELPFVSPSAQEAPSDLELIRAIGAGSEGAFRQLYRRWAPRLGRFLLQSTQSRETADDLLQEAFLRILRAAHRFEPRASVAAWMHRICANLAYSHWRRRRASPVAEGVDVSLLPDPPARVDLDRERIRRSFEQDAQAALTAIPENQRMVFLLKIDRGLTYEEIAAVLRCPVGTAKSRFHHAVRKLRAALEEWDTSSTQASTTPATETPGRAVKVRPASSEEGHDEPR